MSSVTATNSNSGQQLLTAALSKNQQKAEGKMALALLDAAAQVQTAVQSQPSANLGNHVNIKA
ncbi:MAG: hypothetical protein HRU22_09250 [Gammaproteobacteria bacterium]|nr:hypothetical protein [Gammaproteobacteria bacterium]